MDFEKEAREDFEVLHKVETEWLAEALSDSIANLGYPVGCGVGLSKESADRAASKIVDRYIDILWRIRKTAYLSGQESMREGDLACLRAERDSWKFTTRAFADDPAIKANCQASERALTKAIERIRSLPLQSNDEKELG